MRFAALGNLRVGSGRTVWALAIGVAIAGAQAHPVARDVPAPVLTVRLEPGPADVGGHLTYVDVTLTVQAADAPAGTPLLSLPSLVANVTTAATTLQRLEASDANGTVALSARDDAQGAAPPERRWVAARPVSGDLVVRYRVPIDNTPPKRTGPPIALRAEGGGFSGAGTTFVLVPAGAARYRLAIRWALGWLGPGASGTSSFGDGDVDLPAPGAAADVSSAFFMAGPLHRHPQGMARGGFSAVWLDTLPFEPQPLMAWTARLYDWYLRFFKGAPERPYRVFLRFNPVNPGGGVGLVNSFVVTWGEGTTAESVKSTLAHEMLHTFAPEVGEGGDSAQWFSEGVAVHYQRLLPLRAGAIGPQAFLDDLNETAARYYTNALNTVPDGQIGARFWEDTRIRVLPYDRGAMYMAAVDARIRKASGGRRTLDDLLFALLDRQKQGQPNTPAVWVDLLAREVGAGARTDHEAMLAGALVLPPPDAFGPCFTRTTKRLRRFELGFDPRVMNEPGRVVHGLVAGSEAERAGLRNGDEITVPVGLDGVQGDQTGMLTLRIRRGEQVFPVAYLPRGETVDAYQWTRVPGVPDSACRY